MSEAFEKLTHQGAESPLHQRWAANRCVSCQQMVVFRMWPIMTQGDTWTEYDPLFDPPNHLGPNGPLNPSIEAERLRRRHWHEGNFLYEDDLGSFTLKQDLGTPGNGYFPTIHSIMDAPPRTLFSKPAPFMTFVANGLTLVNSPPYPPVELTQNGWSVFEWNDPGVPFGSPPVHELAGLSGEIASGDMVGAVVDAVKARDWSYFNVNPGATLQCFTFRDLLSYAGFNPSSADGYVEGGSAGDFPVGFDGSVVASDNVVWSGIGNQVVTNFYPSGLLNGLQGDGDIPPLHIDNYFVTGWGMSGVFLEQVVAVRTRFKNIGNTELMYFIAEGNVSPTFGLCDVVFAEFGTLLPKQIKEISWPAGPFPVDFTVTGKGDLSAGAIRFAIIGVTPSTWVAYSGVPMGQIPPGL